MKVVPKAVRCRVVFSEKVPGKMPEEVFEAASWIVLVVVKNEIGPKNPPIVDVCVNGRTEEVIAIVSVSETLLAVKMVVVEVTAGMLVVVTLGPVPPIVSVVLVGMTNVGTV